MSDFGTGANQWQRGTNRTLETRLWWRHTQCTIRILLGGDHHWLSSFTSQICARCARTRQTTRGR